jgi:hypothetical protein
VHVYVVELERPREEIELESTLVNSINYSQHLKR